MGRWHEALSETFQLLGFQPFKAEPDLWLRDAGSHWKYVAVYSDNLLVLSKDPVKILKGSENLYSLKRIGKPEFYFGGDVNVIKMSKGYTHAFFAKTYIKNVCDKIERLFETTLRNYGSPLDGGISPRIGYIRFTHG